ncbi:hypothetical protein [Daejeonella sp.]|uniref:hypothetical protein n=1 Tax=Daejeonella sp. TaxID=2805397 RepID=UPI0025C68A0A|nr:hypothetical protein [Daejeonella sp.]
MSAIVLFFVKVIFFLSILYLVLKVGKIVYNALKSQLGGTVLSLIDEKKLAVDTKARFESLNELEVLKFVMDKTGWNLADSKAFCDKIKLQTVHVPKAKSTEMPQEPSPTLKNHISKEELEINVREKIVAIGKLETISYIIKNTGWTLKESKSFCDKIEDELNKANLSKYPKLNQVPSANSSKSNFLDEANQIKYIIEKTGWNHEKAKAYFEDIQNYENDSRKTYTTK